MMYLSIGKLVSVIMILIWVLFMVLNGILVIFGKKSKLYLIRSLSVFTLLSLYTTCIAGALAIGTITIPIIRDFVVATLVCCALYAVGVVCDSKLQKVFFNSKENQA